MPKKIIIVRHGETDFNIEKIIQGHLDTLLNPQGYLQAKSAAEKLKKEKIDIIITSDLKRTYHTALVIAQRYGLKVISTPLLRERYFGKFQGKSITEIRRLVWSFGYYEDRKFDDQIEEKTKKFGVETDQAMFNRLRKLLKYLTRFKDKTVVIVSHGGTIRQLLKLFNYNFTTKIGNTECFYLIKDKNNYYRFISPSFPASNQRR